MPQTFGEVVDRGAVASSHERHGTDEARCKFIECCAPHAGVGHHELRGTRGCRRAQVGDEVGDRIFGIVGGYIRWSGRLKDGLETIAITERLAQRQLEPFARECILMAAEIR